MRAVVCCLLVKQLLHSPPVHRQKMIGQSKISAFFTSSTKRASSSCGSENEPSKKIKLSEPSIDKLEGEEKVASPSKSESAANGSLSLTPEQKERIEARKKAAMTLLHGKNQNTENGNCSLVVDVGSSWYRALSGEFSKSYFKELSNFVEAERKRGTVYPPGDQVFTWTRMCEITDVKVVILGQDPYHGPRQAHGLCFSVQKGIPPPPSLENMFTELSNDIEGFEHPGHGVLTGWAKQGVLLLNACLTVRTHQANSHAGKGWEQFTDAVISWLNKNSKGIVFMLWGSYAQKKGACIDKKKHHILKAVHPSPLSAHRGFIGCKHFSECNRLLKKEGKTPIDWTKLPPE